MKYKIAMMLYNKVQMYDYDQHSFVHSGADCPVKRERERERERERKRETQREREGGGGNEYNSVRYMQTASLKV